MNIKTHYNIKLLEYAESVHLLTEDEWRTHTGELYALIKQRLAERFSDDA